VTVVLGLEAIGDDLVQLNRLRQTQLRESGVPDHLRRSADLGPILRRPWVAEIKGPDARFGWERTFVHGKKDYSRANSIGSRGVMVYHHLREGPVYEVNAWLSWSSVDRYFCRVAGTELIRLTEDQVRARLGLGE